MRTYSQNRDKIAEYFNKTGFRAWEALTNETPVSKIRLKVRQSREKMRRKILSILPNDLSRKRVLDAGCGPGQFSIELAQRGASVLGIETNIEFETSEMMKDHGKFDYIILMDSLIHYPENDTMCLLESLLKNTNEKIIFTLVPSNFILSLKLKIGRLLPRADRSPTLSPLNINNFIKEYQKKFDKEFGVSLASIGKVNDLFYTSEVLELKK